MLTLYEFFYLLFTPFLPALYGKIRKDVKRLVPSTQIKPVKVLDVGGRNSPYTIAFPYQVTVLDLPRESDIQNQLHLGVSADILKKLQKKRSNIEQVLFENMVNCTLSDNSFDGVICIEVIEHVLEDREFIRQIARVLKPGGWAYFTTPNGDYIRNEGADRNPDHIRHYRREELANLLKTEFNTVDVHYGVKTGKYRMRGLRSFSVRKPIETVDAMLSNLISRWESRNCSDQSQRTAHLFASVQKNT